MRLDFQSFSASGVCKHPDSAELPDLDLEDVAECLRFRQ